MGFNLGNAVVESGAGFFNGAEGELSARATQSTRTDVIARPGREVEKFQRIVDRLLQKPSLCVRNQEHSWSESRRKMSANCWSGSFSLNHAFSASVFPWAHVVTWPSHLCIHGGRASSWFC